MAALILMTLGGVSYAGYSYSQEYAGRILPGSTIAGVDVSGMTRDQALAAVKKVVRPSLTRVTAVRFGDQTWRVTPRRLGATSNAAAVVAGALAASERTSFLERTKMRLSGDGLGFHRDVAFRYPRKGVGKFVAHLASRIDQPAVDASLDYSSGWLEIAPGRAGRKVLQGKSRAALYSAIVHGKPSASLSVVRVSPARTAADYDKVLLVHIGENRLYLYENGEITHTWRVATGTSDHPTPTGVYEITEKRYMPTWVNPDPNGWGAELPASIPPGPSNPLGLRALNWSAPAIRFHGTTATYSLGYNASHGCVRMSNADVIELYGLVDVGTPIISMNYGDYRPLVVSTPDPTPTPGHDSVGPGGDDRAGKPGRRGSGKGKGN